MLSIIIWYLLISLLGWLTFPLAYRLLPALGGRGFAFSRILGLLLWGYIFWLLASLGILQNDLGGLLLALFLVIALSVWALRGIGLKQIGTWLQEQSKLVLSVEMLFLLSFAFMTLVRASNPEILGTEKPMELAFINAIMRSPVYPPHDPWLSGFAISYYYFGYVIIAILAKMTGVVGSVAFNLGISSIFALTAVGAYGMLYDLLVLRRQPSDSWEAPNPSQKPHASLLAWLGPLFILLMSNVEGFLEALHARGLFWRLSENGELTSSFWSWLDIPNLKEPPTQPFSWIPSRYYWWWRASRVVQDYDFQGNWKEIIDEFPVFSYVLADLHPHVLAMPFAFLAMALSLNIFLGGGQGQVEGLRRRVSTRTLAWLVIAVSGVGLVLLWLGLGSLSLLLAMMGVICLVLGGFLFVTLLPQFRLHGLSLFTGEETGEKEIGFPIYLGYPTLILSSLVLGGMAFLNTWDFPFYVALFAGSYVLRRWQDVGGKLSLLVRDFLAVSLVVGIGGILLYFPFYLGFSSQAGGIIPNFVYPTRGAHLWVMFATLLVFIISYLVYLWKFNGDRKSLQKGFVLTLGFVILLILVMLFLSVIIFIVPGLGDLFLSSIAAPDFSAMLKESLFRRVTSFGGWLTLFVLSTLTLGLLLKFSDQNQDEREELPLSSVFLPSNAFTLLLILLGLVLVIGPEFLYLRDLFGWRINTIFKFYYQVWLLWGIAAAYSVAVLLVDLRNYWRVIFRIVLVVTLVVGLTYTTFAIWTKTNGFQPPSGLSLDGVEYLERQSPEEMAAIRWLSRASLGVVAEAVGGSYTATARVSTLSGQPTVLGWPGHESQWRGGSQEIGSRQGDIERLYCTKDWVEAQSIIEQYDIRYIYVGSQERIAYSTEKCLGGLNETKFLRNLNPVFSQTGVTIYESP